MTGNTESILHTKAGQTFLTHGPQRVLKLGGRARAGADARSVMKRYRNSMESEQKHAFILMEIWYL